MTPVPGSPEVGVPFVAPTSGKVWINVGGLCQNDTGTGRIAFEFEVYEARRRLVRGTT